MTITYGNGIGESLGDSLVTCRPLLTSGNVWYVNSNGGVNAASPAGQNREKPLATLAQAHTNALNDDIIVLMSGHTETLVANLNITKRLVIVGAGSSGGKPTVKLLNNSAAAAMFTINSSNVEFRNIWFPPNVQTNGAARINTTLAFFRMIGCYVECGATDTGAAVSMAAGSDSARIVNSTFISVATVVTAQPLSGVSVLGALNDLELSGVVFSAGTVGFSDYRAFDAGGAVMTRIVVDNVSLLLGADFSLLTGWSGRLNFQTVTGGSRVDV